MAAVVQRDAVARQAEVNRKQGRQSRKCNSNKETQPNNAGHQHSMSPQRQPETTAGDPKGAPAQGTSVYQRRPRHSNEARKERPEFGCDSRMHRKPTELRKESNTRQPTPQRATQKAAPACTSNNEKGKTRAPPAILCAVF